MILVGVADLCDFALIEEAWAGLKLVNRARIMRMCGRCSFYDRSHRDASRALLRDDSQRSHAHALIFLRVAEIDDVALPDTALAGLNPHCSIQNSARRCRIGERTAATGTPDIHG